MARKYTTHCNANWNLISNQENNNLDCKISQPGKNFEARKHQVLGRMGNRAEGGMNRQTAAEQSLAENS